MKELTIKVTPEIADKIAADAKAMGLTSEEYLKYNIGLLATSNNDPHEGPHGMVKIASGVINLGSLMGDIQEGMWKSLILPSLKQMAAKGDLKCKRCTMKISVEDVEKGECGACGFPLKQMLDAPGDAPLDGDHE